MLQNTQNAVQDSEKKYDKLVEFGDNLKAQVERKIEVRDSIYYLQGNVLEN